MKKWVWSIAGGSVVLLSVAWLWQAELLLALLTVRTSTETVQANRELHWQTPSPSASKDQPNIIFILVDDLGINDLSTFGGGVADGRVATPNIDRLAREGMTFNNAYAGTASCAPSRAMLLTGRYPTRTGFEFTPTPDGMDRALSIIANQGDRSLPPLLYDAETADAQPEYAAMGLPSSEITIAEMLQEAGYYTAHIGKWHLGRGAGSHPNDQGFDDSLLMASGLYLPEDHPDAVNARLPFDPVDRFLWARMRYAASFNNSEWFEPDGYVTDYWTREAVSTIRTHSEQPFFLYLAHWGVHTPLQATREDYDAVGDITPHRLRVYAAMVRALDRSVGTLLETLEEEGIADNTLVVFSSDNGGPGYIGLPDINAPYRGWKLTLYEGGLRIPLFMRWPGKIPAGGTSDHPVAHIDMMPTLATAAAAPLPASRIIDGRTLLPLAFGESDTAPHEALFWHSGSYAAVRADQWKLQRSELPEFTYLFNLTADPTEQRDVSEAHPDRVAELQRLLDDHLEGRKAPLYPYSLEAPVAVDKTLAEPFLDGDSLVYWPN